MWTSNRKQDGRSQEAPGDVGVVTLGGDPAGKVHLLLEYDGGGEIADPWYTGDFETAYQDILRGCEAFLRAIAP